MPPPNTRSETLTPQETVEQYQKEFTKRINNTSKGSSQRRRWRRLYEVAARPDATTTSIWNAVTKQRENKMNKTKQLPQPKPKPKAQEQQKELPGMRTFAFSATAAHVQPDFVYYAPQNTDHRSIIRSNNWSSQPTASIAHAPHSTTMSSSTREARPQSTNKPGTVVPATSSRSTHTPLPGDPPQGVNARPIVDNSKGSGHSPSHRNTKKQKQKKTTPAPSQLSSTGPSMVQNDENPVRASASAPLPVQSAHSQKSKAHNVKSTSRPSTPEPHSPTKKTIPGSPKPTGSTKSSPSRRAKSSDVDMFGGDITDWDTQMEKFDFEEYAKSFNDFVESYNSYQNEMFGWQTEGGG